MKRQSENADSKKKKFKQNSTSGELGTILSVTLQNFMCHDHLKFDFGPNINFIIGPNGSGKSAILTGIVLALGGKSTYTGRYSNIKGFVKTGKRKALISVTLKNCGGSAYKPDIYGDKIIVERELSIEGVSSYKLKDSSGKIVSTLKEELTNVLLTMDIQVDNPVLVLTQETSRNFLMAKTGKEEKLFEFFYRGTGLQKLYEDYKEILSLNEESTKDLALKKQALDAQEKELKRLEKLRESDKKIDELKRESFWARVILMEKELEAKQNEEKKLVKEIEISKQEAEKSKNKYNSHTLASEQAEKERDELQSKLEAERKTLSEILKQTDACVDDVRRSKGEVDRYQREEAKLCEDIQVIQEAINEQEMRGQIDYENEKKVRNEQILRLEEQKAEMENQQADFERQQQSLLQLQSSRHGDINMLKLEINDLKEKKRIAVERYNQHNNSKKNRQFLFGEHTPRVLEDIRHNENKFKKLPRGPIGLDIEVKDQKWVSAVESCIKPHMLRSFCVDNSHDSVLMAQILQKYYSDKMPSVIVSPFLSCVHDVSRHKAQTNIPTVLDMLIIKDPVIANCLIDQLSIENIILIEDITTANNIMLDSPPRQCYSAFLQNCDEILLNPYRFYSASRLPNNVLSRTVSETYLEEIKQNIAKFDTEIEAKENTIMEIRREIQNGFEELKKLEGAIVNLTAIMSNTLNNINELRQYEELKNVPEMRDEFVSLNADLEKKQEELRIANEKLKDHTLKYKEACGKVGQQKELCNNLREQFDCVIGNIRKFVKEKEVLASSKKLFEESLKAAERNLQKIEQEIKLTDEGIKKTIIDREKVDNKPRIRTKRSYEEIDLQIEEMQKVFSDYSNSKDKEALLEKYTEKSKKLLDAKRNYKLIENDNKKLNAMIKKRESRRKSLLEYTIFVVNLSFTVLLSGNGYSGGIKFKKNAALELQAVPERKASAPNEKKKTCSALSGGERSFVTIAFLLALWDRIQMPFRMLDEYDVFMDISNRYLSINLLIKKANHMRDVQFIFLSPQELPELNESDANIKILKMEAPKRIGLSNLEE